MLMIKASVMRVNVMLAGAVALVLSTGGTGFASRCKSVNGFTGGLHCGLDSDTHPANENQACTEAAIENLPLKCAPGDIRVIYDLDKPFPLDATHTSYLTIRAAPNSPCAAMTDTIPPLSGEGGAIKVPVTGFVVGCWSPPDKDGCRMMKVLNGGSMCLHAGHEPLGPGCTDPKCVDVSTEQIAISNAGAADHYVCPPRDPATSCRATRGSGEERFRLWIGGFCATNGCADPGVDPKVDDDTCVAQWGATYLGYNRPAGKGINEPGNYDWGTGAFKLDYTNGKATCGTLGTCLGKAAGKRAQWDLSLIGVPRASTPPPCLADPNSSCNPTGCIP